MGDLSEFVRRPIDAVRVIDHIATVVATSYVQDGFRRTLAEDKRRTNMCIDSFRSLRKDYGWSIDKSLDHLLMALRHRLDGVPWQPAPGGWWGAA